MFSWGAVFLLRIQREGYIYPQPVFIAHGHLTAVCFYYSVGKRQTQPVRAVRDSAETFEHRLVDTAAVVGNADACAAAAGVFFYLHGAALAVMLHGV